MNRLKSIIAAAMVVTSLSFLPATTAFAADANPSKDISSGVSAIGGGDANQGDLNTAIKAVVNVLLYLLGAIAVIMIIIGGIRYATSNGDSAQLQSAKNTILYAVIGVVIALIAYAIVNFFISTFTKK